MLYASRKTCQNSFLDIIELETHIVKAQKNHKIGTLWICDINRTLVGYTVLVML